MNMKEYKVLVYDNGDKHWYLNGKCHREDGPAVECSDGSKRWYINGKYHREDGPAVVYSDGYKSWYINGKCHREDGPAIEYSGGSKEWYINGKKLTEKEFNTRKQSCDGRVVEIDGIKYRLSKVK